MQPQDQQPKPQQTPPQPTNDREWRVTPPADPSINDNNPGQPTQVVFSTRPFEPQEPQVPNDVQQRHEEAKRKHPDLNLSDGEYVISAVRRHPIGLLNIWGTVGLVDGILLVVMVLYLSNLNNISSGVGSSGISNSAVAGLLLLIMILIGLGGVIAATIYNGNRFFLTNESVIQYIQTGLFAKRQQTVSLGSVEDSSYTQTGILPTVFNYGSIRLSTVGDETTYRFRYVADPKKQVAVLNNAVEDFKNGRPVRPE